MANLAALRCSIAQRNGVGDDHFIQGAALGDALDRRTRKNRVCAIGIDFFGAALFEHFGGFDQGAGGVDHVIHDDAVAAVDIADGFIHFSTAAQVEETARKHFRGQSDLLLLAFEDRDLGEGLHYEPSRNGELFPHLYDTLDVNLVRSTKALVMNADGTHRFTGLLL